MESSRRKLTKLAGLALLALGCVIGAATVSALVFDWMPSIPDWMVRIGMIKLGLLASGGLLAAGAILGRRVMQAREARVEAIDETPQLNAGNYPAAPIHRVERDAHERR